MTKRMRNALVAMAAWAAIGVFAVADPLGIFGASISISWEAPTTRENGATLDPETEIAEYVIYAAQGEDVDDTEEVLRVTGDLRGATLELDLEPRAEPYSYVIAATAVDTDGMESRKSDPVHIDVFVGAEPVAPSLLKIDVSCGRGCLIEVKDR